MIHVNDQMIASGNRQHTRDRQNNKRNTWRTRFDLSIANPADQARHSGMLRLCRLSSDSRSKSISFDNRLGILPQYIAASPHQLFTTVLLSFYFLLCTSTYFLLCTYKVNIDSFLQIAICRLGRIRG